ncbi:SOS response-associated peptidase [Luteimonas suaedae]|uniref:SOS response-associated peptidase n=1 Tax=Luteimonas suaedae TaxID=2605430 RepID=UPI0011ED1749|nr:SOS response-associated peptidase family protein [Luteimonas suaedae]
MRRFVQAFALGGLPGELPPDVAATLAGMPERYNIAVRKPAAVIFGRGDGLRVEEFDWGLIPRWAALPETKYTTVTARLERAPKSRIFRRPWETRRCVVPMNGYYKWDRSAAPAQPYFIQARDGAALFAAGLWDHREKDEPQVYSFAVLTQANAAIPPPLVPDGPVFLPAAEVAEWIAGPRLPTRFLSRMAQPALEAYPVSRAIARRDVDDYTLLEPVDPLEDAIANVGFDDEEE